MKEPNRGRTREREGREEAARGGGVREKEKIRSVAPFVEGLMGCPFLWFLLFRAASPLCFDFAYFFVLFIDACFCCCFLSSVSSLLSFLLVCD